MLDISLLDIILAVIALWGAGLATYAAIRKIRKGKPTIRVKISTGFTKVQSGPISEVKYFIEGVNTGEKVVTLNSYGFIFPNDKRVFFELQFSDTRFPCELKPGKNCKVSLEAAKLADAAKSEGFEGSIKIRGYFRDVADKTYLSKPEKFTIALWLTSQESQN